jgi:hypothetical protein
MSGFPRFFATALTLALLAGVTGCRQSLPEKADPDRARQALQASLDVWQKRQPDSTLTGADPPIYFNDPRYRAGARLSAYRLEDGHEFHGQSARISAVLTLEQKESGAKEKKVTYLVDISRAVVIVPD